ncbi:MAG: tRNA epoxyqueuosine(34) reductase QueG [Saprospiraceae bacterium]|uniref:Epoxyqueuosine reductase n=1 Tax=Candidatus Opimibacter skivensis TaxID=2982028 RepID=A0A9D7T269_9BACT|nr:tRNA epoxyqueuosine(34) reductase QueG [Candidatus Opimibacter skivensis]
MTSLTTRWTEKLKELALYHGFMGVGIAKAERMDEEAKHLEEWLAKGYQGEMSYMANHFDMRVDPRKLVPGAKSVVSLLYNYFPKSDPLPLNPDASTTHTQPHATAQQPGTLKQSSNSQLTNDDSSFKISRYAYGEDYHKVVRRKLKELVAELKSEVGDFHGRVFVDSAPVMERDWAKRSGQGWIGKNTLLIHPKKGSYFFLAEIILDIELEYDHPIRDHCGTCTKCIDACPTEAISPEGYLLDGSKCISYLTIELKSKIPDEFKGKMEDWIFGCDICQEVCPWNRFSKPHEVKAFVMSHKLSDLKDSGFREITAEIFDIVFEKSAVKRTGYERLRRNIKFVSKGN